MRYDPGQEPSFLSTTVHSTMAVTEGEVSET